MAERPDSRFLHGPNLNYAAARHASLHRTSGGGGRRKGGGGGSEAKAAGGAGGGANSRYKTELCRPFAEAGTCKYAEKCQFAHGHHELRNVPRHPKYKTERCKTYHSTGFCPYGPRCHFVHRDRDEAGPLPPPLSSSHPLILSLAQQQRQLSVQASLPSSSSSTGSASPSSFSSDDSDLFFRSPPPQPPQALFPQHQRRSQPPPPPRHPSPASPPAQWAATRGAEAQWSSQSPTRGPERGGRGLGALSSSEEEDVLAAGVESLFAAPATHAPKRLPVFRGLSSAAA